MIVAISLDKSFDDYNELSKYLNDVSKNTEFREFCAVPHKLIERYQQEFKKPIQYFKIDWGNMVGATNIKKNAYGKPFNGDAPAVAERDVVEYSTHYIEFGKGDYNINQLAKSKKLQLIAPTHEVASTTKRYQF